METRTLIARARRRAARQLGRPAAAAPAATARPAPRTAILVVNGYDRKGRWGDYNAAEARDYPWIDLCLRQVERHSAGSSYEVLVWDNACIPEQRRLLRRHPRVRRFGRDDPAKSLGHGRALDRLLGKVRPGTEFVITLDTDSFPVRDGWIENLTGRLNGGVLLAGVWRDEMLRGRPAYVHPSCIAVRRDTLLRLGTPFAIEGGLDVGANLTEAVQAVGGGISRLRRSNHWNPHFLMGALYGDLVYHQGAGSRNPQFMIGGDAENHEPIREALRDAAFADVDALIDALAGNRPPETVSEVARLGKG